MNETNRLPFCAREHGSAPLTGGATLAHFLSLGKIINKEKMMNSEKKTTDVQMKAFASAENVIALTEGWRVQLKKFQGQEERNEYLVKERNRYRDLVGQLNQTITQKSADIWDLEQNRNALNGEIVLLTSVLDRKGIDITEPENAEEKRKLPTLKRLLGLTAVVAPYALIASYVVSLYV